MLKLQQCEVFFFFFTFRYSRSCLTLNILTFIWFPSDSYPRKRDLSTKVLLSHHCEIVNSCITGKCGIVSCQRTTENMKSCISLSSRGLLLFSLHTVYLCLFTPCRSLNVFLCGRMFAACSCAWRKVLLNWKYKKLISWTICVEVLFGIFLHLLTGTVQSDSHSGED